MGLSIIYLRGHKLEFPNFDLFLNLKVVLMTAKSVDILVLTVCQSFQNTKVNSACSIILHVFCCLHNFFKIDIFFLNISFKNTSLDSNSTFCWS